MAVSTQRSLVSADDLPALSSRLAAEGKRIELVRGDLVVMAPAGARHGHVASRDAVTFSRMVQALHTAIWLYDLEGNRICRQFLQGACLIADCDFQTLCGAVSTPCLTGALTAEARSTVLGSPRPKHCRIYAWSLSPTSPSARSWIRTSGRGMRRRKGDRSVRP